MDAYLSPAQHDGGINARLRNRARGHGKSRRFAGGLEHSTSEEVSDRLQLIRRTLTGAAVLHNVEAQLLSLAQIRHAGAFDGADVDENVRGAVVRLNESESFL